MMTRLMAVLAAAGVAVVLGAGKARAQARQTASRLAGAEEARARLGVEREYAGAEGLKRVKVAVLDFGFAGVETGRPYMPAGTVVVEHYDPDFVRRNGLGDPAYRKGFEPLNRHGRAMAQIVWAVTGGRPDGPKFYLLNAGGPTLLRRAVRYAVEQRVDVVLFSGSFEGGGNGDGRGPIDAAVSEAVAAGILWVNAAGNNGRRVYNGPVRVLGDGYLRLRDGSDVASLRFRNRLDENEVTVTLTWNDYRDEEDAGTDRDLDLYVEDWAGRRVGASEKVQISGERTAGPDESRNPRERVVLDDLPAAPEIPTDPDYGYRIRIRARRGRFTPADRIRVLLTARRETYLPPGSNEPREAVEFLDATGSGEMYPPADHPGVLTVGAADPASSVGPTADGRAKPEVVLEDSRAYFTDGEVSAGSSNAAAYVTGVVALLKAAEPSLDARALKRIARDGPVYHPPPSARGRAPAGLYLWQTPGRARLSGIVASESGRR
jgi:subtilisin family serine protease